MDKRKTSSVNHSFLQDGKIPPQAIDLEESVLGTIMVYQETLNSVRDILTVDSFYKEAHKIIYSAITELDKNNESYDMTLVINKLKKMEKLEEVGGAYEITLLTNKAFISGVEEKSLIIQQYFFKRELIRIASETINKAYIESEDVFDILNELTSAQNNILSHNTSCVHHIESCVKDVFNVIDGNINGLSMGILTGFKDYDIFSRGDQNGDLIVVAGETSQGKTALCLCKAFNQALYGYNVAIFSYEMSKNQLTARLMALAVEISAKTLLMDKLKPTEFEKLNAKIQKLIDTNIYVIEVERNDYDWLVAKIKTIKNKFNIHCITIDYVQLINVPKLPRNQQVGHISNGLKFLAKHKNINIPITMVSQLRRDDHPKPTLSRLKESGDIENAADTVIGIWMPEYYGMETINLRSEGEISTQGIAVAHILKGRNIGLKDIVLKWEGPLTRFSDYEEAIDDNPF